MEYELEIVSGFACAGEITPAAIIASYLFSKLEILFKSRLNNIL